MDMLQLWRQTPGNLAERVMHWGIIGDKKGYCLSKQKKDDFDDKCDRAYQCIRFNWDGSVQNGELHDFSDDAIFYPYKADLSSGGSWVKEMKSCDSKASIVLVSPG